MRKPSKYYSLMRPKLRMSWNKHNVYNMQRNVGIDRSLNGNMTFFQQKWAAKARARGYHGDHITEKSWKRLFSHRLMSAVDMPPEYLAANDGSEQAAGRGSGKSTNQMTAESYSRVAQSSYADPNRVPTGIQAIEKTMGSKLKEITPYMQMSFAPLERRLDMAIFRALFASSVRQARQFVIHGAVQVNGKKMVHPSYMLNPGDMFQVDPEKVMYGTGQEKKPKHKQAERVAQRQSQRLIQQGEKLEETVAGWTGKTVATETTDADAEADPDAAEAAKPELEDWQQWYVTNAKLKSILREVKGFLHSDPKGPKNLSAAKKQKMRVLVRTAKQMMSIPEGSRQELADELMLQLSTHENLRQQYVEIQEETEQKNAEEAEAAAEIENDVKEVEAKEEEKDGEKKTDDKKKSKKTSQPPKKGLFFQHDMAKSPKSETPKSYNLSRSLEKATQDLTPDIRAKVKAAVGEARLSRDDIRALGRFIVKAEENPIDDSKPYATPWKPKPFMNVFAFIPRYLEVHPHICSAVYLRHPVARKGLAEVPTPFSYVTNQLAHNWYLARGPRDRARGGR